MREGPIWPVARDRNRFASCVRELTSNFPVLARIIDARPDFRPRARETDLPALDGFVKR
jgi:hypothetical protein